MIKRSDEDESDSSERTIADSRETTCCIVGAGPGGAMLALLLARRNIPVILLEAHEDFDRDFRGDTVHPSVLEIMDQLDLADRLLELRHSKIHDFTFQTSDGPVTVANLRQLKTKFPFIAMIPQVHFLEFITKEATRYPSFQLIMGARVEELIEEKGEVRGVRYREKDGWYEVRSHLTVAADGRSSRVRHLTGMEPIKTSPPMDILWFRWPRKPTDPAGALARFGIGHFLVMLDRLDEWQNGYSILKGSYSEVREKGVEAFRGSLAALAPEFADRVEHVKSWKQVSMLSVESSRLKRWYQPGLLLIGDAAHVMSPVGGVGINYAIQDAVVAANLLHGPLAKKELKTADLKAVQAAREWPTRIVQRFQRLIQKRIVASALRRDRAFRLPLLFRIALKIPFIRTIPARLIAFGIRRVRVEE